MLNFPLAMAGRAVVFATALAGGAAVADPPHSRAAGVFRDWRLDCSVAPCVARTVVRGGDGTQLLAMEAVGAADAGAIVLRTALPLHLPDGVTLVLGDDPPLDLAWRTCGISGCVTEAATGPALIAALVRERVADVTLMLEDGVRVRLPVSLLGFSAAREAQAAAD